MRVLVCGGRDYNNWKLGFKFLSAFQERFGISVLIEGGARGADEMAMYWVKHYASPKPVHYQVKAEWDRHGKGAGSIRNQKMLDDCQPDICIAFKGGNGTADMIRRCEAAGVQVIKVYR